MRPRLLATLATHTLVVPLLLVHLAVLSAVGGVGARAAPRPVAVLVAQYWASVFAWEIARKIRAPEEEDDYVTYSRRLGRGGAVALAGAAQAMSVAAGVALTVRAGSGRSPSSSCSGARPVRPPMSVPPRPVPANARLGPPAEAFSLHVRVGARRMSVAAPGFRVAPRAERLGARRAAPGADDAALVGGKASRLRQLRSLECPCLRSWW